MSYWVAPQIWLDATAFVVGGGPSLVGMDLSPIHHRPVLGVNQAYELGPWVDVTYFGDQNWWDWNYKTLLAHPGLIVTNCQSGGGWKEIPGRVKLMKRSNRRGLVWRDRDMLAWNYNSGACAVNLAYHFGASRIVLLGFDMKRDEEKGKRNGHNWHDRHDRFGKGPADNIYETRFLPCFPAIKRDLEEANQATGRHVEILNATPGSALDVFPMVTLEEVL